MAERKLFDLLKIEISDNDNDLKATYEDFENNNSDESPPGVKLNLHEGDEEEINSAIKKLNKGQLRGEDLELLGNKLFRILFPEEIRKIFEEALTSIDRSEGKRVLRIVIEYPERSRIAKWPLELLRRSTPNPIWLATDERLSLSRKIRYGGKIKSGVREPPLRVLLVVSAPKKKPGVMSVEVMESIFNWAEQARMDYPVSEQRSRAERAQIKPGEEAEENAPIEVQLLGRVPDFARPKGKVYLDLPASYANFTEVFKELQPQVLHFIGHGDVQKGQGRLAFVNPQTEEEPQWIYASDMAQLITSGSSSLKLVVLQVCKSATSESQLNLASRMVSLNIPAVVAMQFEIDNYCAVEFASHFYQALARKNDVDYAVQLARFHITQTEDPMKKLPLFWRNREFCTPVIYTYKPGKPGTLIESNPAIAQKIPGGVPASWPVQQISLQEKLNQYTADLAHYQLLGDQVMVDFLQERIDSLKKTSPVSAQAGLLMGQQTGLPAAPKSGRKGRIPGKP